MRSTPSGALADVYKRQALDRPVLMTESKDLWENWVGDLGFLDGTRGDGSREKPFQISTKAQLMGLSRLAAMEMEIKEGEGTYPGDYSGACFELTRDIDCLLYTSRCV